MTLHLFNTLTRTLEPFTPLDPAGKKVGIYSCGPTVYGTPHIGNLRAYIFADTLRRALDFAGYSVTHIINITDVGHLVGDGDGGEDKLEAGAAKEHKTVWQVADGYTQEFFTALKALNIKAYETVGTKHESRFFPRAAAHITEQLTIIKRLTEKGHTYETSDGIYFSVESFPTYGALSRQSIDDKAAGARVAVEDEKKNPADFALWKFCTGENLHHTMRWDFLGNDISSSPHLTASENREKKIGFPGWHIECSAMSLSSLLGTDWEDRASTHSASPLIDIHTGGIDHIPVHHENEIAQTECAFCRPFARYWLHNNFMTVDNQKMSKSLGNVYTLSDISARHLSPLAFRLLCLTSHYQSQVNFTWEALRDADNRLRRFALSYTTLPATSPADDTLILAAKDAISDNLHTPKALAVLEEALTRGSKKSVDALDTLLGLHIASYADPSSCTPTPEEALLLTERTAAKAAKNYARADEIKHHFLSKGITLRDNADGTTTLSYL